MTLDRERVRNYFAPAADSYWLSNIIGPILLYSNSQIAEEISRRFRRIPQIQQLATSSLFYTEG